MQVLQHIEMIYYQGYKFLKGLKFIVTFLIFIQSGESIYDPPHFGFILQHL